VPLTKKLKNEEEKRVQQGQEKRGRETLKKPLPTQEVQRGRNREMEKGIQKMHKHKQAQTDMRVMQ